MLIPKESSQKQLTSPESHSILEGFYLFIRPLMILFLARVITVDCILFTRPNGEYTIWVRSRTNHRCQEIPSGWYTALLAQEA